MRFDIRQHDPSRFLALADKLAQVIIGHFNKKQTAIQARPLFKGMEVVSDDAIDADAIGIVVWRDGSRQVITIKGIPE